MKKLLLAIFVLLSFQCQHSNNTADIQSPDSLSDNHKDSAYIDQKPTSSQGKKQIDTAVVINDAVKIIVDTLYKETAPTNDSIDSTKCSKWQLNADQVVKVIRGCLPIPGEYLHTGYNNLECAMKGKVTIGDKSYKIEINGGSYFILYAADTSYILAMRRIV